MINPNIIYIYILYTREPIYTWYDITDQKQIVMTFQLYL